MDYSAFLIYNRSNLLIGRNNTMINVSGHLRNHRRIIGFEDKLSPLVVNCCGQQILKTKDYAQNRDNGRLDYQIIYLYKGSGHYYINNEWITMTAGNIILFRPGEPQIYNYYAKDTPEVYWIHFTGTECKELLTRFDIHNTFVGESILLKNLFQDIMTEMQLKKTCYNELVIHKLYTMFSYINRLQVEASRVSNDSFSLDRLIMNLNVNYMDNWTVSSMAEFCKFSDSYFSHSFKKYTNTTPIHFLNELRIQKAKELIATNTMSISTIASLVGFEDSLYFSRVFKKFTGISPTQFYESNLKTNTPTWWSDNK